MQTNKGFKKRVDLKGQNPFNTPHAQIAQSVEQRIENPRVGGSIPPLGTILKASQMRGFFYARYKYITLAAHSKIPPFIQNLILFTLFERMF